LALESEGEDSPESLGQSDVQHGGGRADAWQPAEVEVTTIVGVPALTGGFVPQTDLQAFGQGLALGHWFRPPRCWCGRRSLVDRSRAARHRGDGPLFDRQAPD